MKLKLFAILSVLLLLTGCNDESDNSADQRIADNLPGTWQLKDVQSESEARYVDITFTQSGQFAYTYTKMTLNTIKSYSVEGTWNVKSSTLELYYNVSSLSCTGMRDEEVRSMQTSLKDNNLMIDDLKDSKQAYGMPIELTRLTSGEGYMKLSKSADLAGNYTLVLAQ